MLLSYLAIATTVVLVLTGSAGGTRGSVPATDMHAASAFLPLPGLGITFAANSTAEVNSLIATDRPYIQPGDSFDLASGNPENTTLNTGEINHWASLLREAFPSATIFAHTAGVSHLSTLVTKASANIAGVFYDYEPHYEPEFSANFSQTVGEFENATNIAHSQGLLSIGYPTGQPIASAQYRIDDWNYGVLAEKVDQLVVQSQTYCHKGITSYRNAVSDVLGQYAQESAPGVPTFQITLGVNASLTPNQVTPSQAYNCARVLTDFGLSTLYLWWGPNSNPEVQRFLEDIGRTPTSGN